MHWVGAAAHEHVGRWWQIKRREGFEDGWQRFLD
jgi:hypothetical protein